MVGKPNTFALVTELIAGTFQGIYYPSHEKLDTFC